MGSQGEDGEGTIVTAMVAYLFILGGAIIVLTPSLLILIQCLAGWMSVKNTERAMPGNTRLLVIIPAHNEGSDIEATCTEIQAVAAEDGVDLRIVIIADNCSDNTAEVATSAQMEVLERNEPDRRGKGYALAWAMETLGFDSWDGLVVLDADARVSSGFFTVIADEIRRGTPAMQAYYSIDGSQNRRTALMELALSLCNGARPLGRYTLGGSASIAGNGFALSRSCLSAVPFRPSAALAEDLEHGLALVMAGYRVKLLPEARVFGAPAGDNASAVSQRTRWEAGRVHAIRRWLPRLLRRHTWASLESALDLMIPPLAITTLLQVVVVGTALAMGNYDIALLAAGGPAFTLVSLIVACRAVGLPFRTLFSLHHVAWYVFWKLGIYFQKAFWQQKAWVRTLRPR